jgi:hypothetical protein
VSVLSEVLAPQKLDDERFIVSRIYEPGSGWGQADYFPFTPEMYTTVLRPKIGMDKKGNALAVWSASGIYTCRYIRGKGWEETQVLRDSDEGNIYIYGMDFSVNESGEGILAWLQDRQDEPENTLHAMLHHPKKGWQEAVQLGRSTPAGFLHAKIDENQNSFVVLRRKSCEKKQ